MTVDELQKVLDRIPNPKPSYSICGLDVGCCLSEYSGLYSVYDVDERGNRYYYVKDVSEEEACDVMYKKIIAITRSIIESEYSAVLNRLKPLKQEQRRCFIASSDGVTKIKG